VSLSDWYKKDYKEVDNSSSSIESQRALFEKTIPGHRLMRRDDGLYSYNYVQKAFEDFCNKENEVVTSVEDIMNDTVVVEERGTYKYQKKESVEDVVEDIVVVEEESIDYEE